MAEVKGLASFWWLCSVVCQLPSFSDEQKVLFFLVFHANDLPTRTVPVRIGLVRR